MSSDVPEHPEHPVDEPAARPADEGDPWAAACAEDLAAEQARRRARYGPQPGDAAEELRRLADTLAERLGDLGSRLGPQVGLFAKPLARQARSAVEPVIERNAEAFEHLASAGQELLAAYRAAVLDQEGRWARPSASADQPAEASRPEPGADPGNRDDPDDSAGSGGAHRIDLD
ncbi:DUF5304 family protein [Streptomyces profundus]|uniref:DUF5304 family protein n=1 Tax=Streptomyces profundus TaxID=2867410 RepID=UPI001D16E43B|nr:DUF5304 family protein [Streptomyces sp. MA3_2.13]UED83718.1 DUF5304 domain-containing protein [Streptomyces sp. MA3_2.13]